MDDPKHPRWALVFGGVLVHSGLYIATPSNRALLLAGAILLIGSAAGFILLIVGSAGR